MLFWKPAEQQALGHFPVFLCLPAPLGTYGQEGKTWFCLPHPTSPPPTSVPGTQLAFGKYHCLTERQESNLIKWSHVNTWTNVNPLSSTAIALRKDHTYKPHIHFDILGKQRPKSWWAKFVRFTFPRSAVHLVQSFLNPENSSVLHISSQLLPPSAPAADKTQAYIEMINFEKQLPNLPLSIYV